MRKEEKKRRTRARGQRQTYVEHKMITLPIINDKCIYKITGTQ
jgi:hypothetical protein